MVARLGCPSRGWRMGLGGQLLAQQWEGRTGPSEACRGVKQALQLVAGSTEAREPAVCQPARGQSPSPPCSGARARSVGVRKPELSLPLCLGLTTTWPPPREAGKGRAGGSSHPLSLSAPQLRKVKGGAFPNSLPHWPEEQPSDVPGRVTCAPPVHLTGSHCSLEGQRCRQPRVTDENAEAQVPQLGISRTGFNPRQPGCRVCVLNRSAPWWKSYRLKKTPTFFHGKDVLPLNTNCMCVKSSSGPGSVLSSLQTLSLTTASKVGAAVDPYFADEETEARMVEVTAPGSCG